ncbi:MAG: hypothetical protein MJE77_15370 [Proteobacteria bacterium]|nr:hypothetical protein [Pseudomonadota bacterium]
MNASPVMLAFCLGTVGMLAASPVHAEKARDFAAEAVLFYRMVACAEGQSVGGTGRSGMDATSVEMHCRDQVREIEKFRARFVRKALPFFAAHRPVMLPRHVFYPFGGGDLISALVTYPDATEITTVSLEHAGDPRRLARLTGEPLRDHLAAYRVAVLGLLRNHDSASAALRTLERGPIPGQLSFFIQALAIMEYEPISLRFFRIEPDGSLRYYTRSEIAALETKKARRKAMSWVDTDYSVAFSNMELRFRRRGAGAGKPVKIHRHIAANLNNDRFPDSPLHKHLLAKGKVAAMTKAASYLLWTAYFSKLRDYLLANMVFMISDSTGIPPLHADKAGFEQITFGRFTGSFLEASELHNQAFRELWESQPNRVLRFRYGYWDAQKYFHLVITRRRGSGT